MERNAMGNKNGYGEMETNDRRDDVFYKICPNDYDSGRGFMWQQQVWGNGIIWY